MKPLNQTSMPAAQPSGTPDGTTDASLPVVHATDGVVVENPEAIEQERRDLDARVTRLQGEYEATLGPVETARTAAIAAGVEPSREEYSVFLDQFLADTGYDVRKNGEPRSTDHPQNKPFYDRYFIFGRKYDAAALASPDAMQAKTALQEALEAKLDAYLRLKRAEGAAFEFGKAHPQYREGYPAS
jgi:hypothetical protein